ncbi:hypothetical protein QMM42_13020 [Leptospira santarosai]|uniref:Uncharacterized protein n=1 Tax=Leptospira santarosai serovar Arenal str. MAVJ 401 TaxID=1049976 RepID=M6JU78_9LEPT|nr:hypothetical protein [Leptospira santarosai]EMM77027.1 hypothetical protein LEP1GSC040_0051 [Leptospira santarosai str. 2000030832]EMN23168.1 hypothetical protein LEP1GSC063_2660 [Leptospira santarosai serovar Arenal str. MAVJ 401]MDI7187123.1 hypothetical protein [Leptospira santarosai]
MSKLPLEVREVLKNIQDLAATDSNQSDNVDEIYHLTERVLAKYDEVETTPEL